MILQHQLQDTKGCSSTLFKPYPGVVGILQQSQLPSSTQARTAAANFGSSELGSHLCCCAPQAAVPEPKHSCLTSASFPLLPGTSGVGAPPAMTVMSAGGAA